MLESGSSQLNMDSDSRCLNKFMGKVKLIKKKKKKKKKKISSNITQFTSGPTQARRILQPVQIYLPYLQYLTEVSVGSYAKQLVVVEHFSINKPKSEAT
jgi:hypothetical protein